MTKGKLNAKVFGLTGGIMWGLCMFLMTNLAVGTGYGEELLKIAVSIYPGYSITILGSIVGLIYGFVDAFVTLYIFVRLYNKLLERFK